MLTGSSYLPREQASSQRWLQTRPQTDGNGMLAPDGPVRICISLLADEGDIPLGALTGGAGIPARSYTPLLDGIRSRNRLRRETIGSLTGAQLPVKGIAYVNRTDAGAVAAAGALRLVHVTRLPAHPHLVIANVTCDGFDLAEREQPDLWMASHGHHFRCEYSGRTVEGREGLVELRHMPADAQLPLHQINLLPGIRQFQR